jgi:hypothetical protein
LLPPPLPLWGGGGKRPSFPGRGVWRSLRDAANDVLANIDGVLRTILGALCADPPPNLPLKGEGVLKDVCMP